MRNVNNVGEADHGELKQLIRPVRGFKALKTACATINRALSIAEHGSYRVDGDEHPFRRTARSIRNTKRLAEAGIEPTVGRVGDSIDNALAEPIIGLYKTEGIRPRGAWRGVEAVEFATRESVDWSNNRRLLEVIGNR